MAFEVRERHVNVCNEGREMNEVFVRPSSPLEINVVIPAAQIVDMADGSIR